MGVAWMQANKMMLDAPGNGGRWLPTALATAAGAGGSDAEGLVAFLNGEVLSGTGEPELPPSVSVTDCRCD